jgi:hypothetical protein
MVYCWQRQLFSARRERLCGTSEECARPSAVKIKALEETVTRKAEVLSELREEHLNR